MNQKANKFHMQSELELFKALQKFGDLSNNDLSKKTGMSATTIQHIKKRMKDRAFYHIGLVPKFEKFGEIPIAFIGFPSVEAKRLRKLQVKSAKDDHILGLIHNEKELLLIVVHKDRDLFIASF